MSTGKTMRRHSGWIWLLVVSFVWAFSFGLIKGRLAGVDPALVSLLRVTLSLLVFAPLFRWKGLRAGDALLLTGIGAVQFGLMYVVYTAAFAHLRAYEVAVWTIFTPLFVCVFEDAMARRLHLWPFVAAILAMAGGAVVSPLTGEALVGIGLVQASNAFFAAGQVAYRRWRRARPGVADAQVFALPYLGAVIATLPPALPALGLAAILTPGQWITLAYLGVVASGLGFFLWNHGAARTTPGLLAVLNNAKIPLGVMCALLFFGEEASLGRLLVGGGLVLVAGLLAGWREPGD
jgi:drug/metabolite transporter (DMT)-like permease